MPACSKRPKGAPNATTEKQRSRMPRRCPDSGGPSGKTNNGGKAPTFEQSVVGVDGVRRTVKTQPGKRRPSRYTPINQES